MISFGLEEDQQIIQETVRKLAAEELRPKLRELEKDGVPAALRRRFDELGLGLEDVGLSTAVLVHEELAFGDPGAAVALSAPHEGGRAIAALAARAGAVRAHLHRSRRRRGRRGSHPQPRPAPQPRLIPITRLA